MTSPGGAATWLERSLSFDIGATGDVVQRTHLRLLLEEPADIEDWSAYSVYLDDHRALDTFEASIVGTDGKREKVRKKKQDRVEYSGGSTTYGSAYYHVVELEGLEVGTVLEIDHTVTEKPYYPSDYVALSTDEPIAELEIEIKGAPLRWRLDGPAEGYDVTEVEDGLVLRGQGIEQPEPSPLAASASARRPVLRFAWGGGGDWESVGRWYRDLLGDLPRSSPVVASLATELSAAATTPRQRLEAYLAHLRRKVRYVAVEVGIGGYRPSSPAEVVERRWGDCKDKALLLIDLLKQSDIEAFPALILLDQDGRIDRQFPSPDQFNHLIVAVPADQVAVERGDPVAEGFLFLDPTQPDGSGRYLHPGVQDQDALIVTDEGGRIVRTPTQPADESHSLAFVLEVGESGAAEGHAALVLKGRVAASVIDELENAPPERTIELALEIFHRIVPAARVERVGYQEVEAEIPTAHFSVAVSLDRLVDFEATRPTLRLPLLEVTPEPRYLDDAVSPLVYQAQEGRTLWQLKLPDNGCLPTLDPVSVDNEIGSFQQTLARADDGTYEIERVARVDKRWIEMEEVPKLKELSVAERRASRRRIRLDCSHDA